MTGAVGAVAVIVILISVAPDRGDGGAGEEVRASPGHSGFLFLARPANLEFIRSDFSFMDSWESFFLCTSYWSDVYLLHGLIDAV